MHCTLQFPVRRKHGEGGAELFSPGSRQHVWEWFNAAPGRFIQDVREYFLVESLEQASWRGSHTRGLAVLEAFGQCPQQRAMSPSAPSC